MLGYDMSHECVSGHLNILNWATLFTILHMTLPVTPVYAVILILRSGIAKKLGKERTMSENTRHLHAQLLKVMVGHFSLFWQPSFNCDNITSCFQAISYQACIPVFFFIAVLTYAVGQLGILNDPLLEYSSFIFVGIIPMLSPLTSLYFVRPYRMWVSKNLFRRRDVISVAQHVRESSNTRTGVRTNPTMESHYGS